MENTFFSLSFSHKNTPIDLREKLAISNENYDEFVTSLKNNIDGLDEIILLSTCNRVEFYTISQNTSVCMTGILNAFSKITNIPLIELEKHACIAQGAESIHHIFSVVSGLDSVVLGETQITGQIKDAYKRCFELGACNQQMTRLIHFAFRVAANVRNQTQISKNSLSVASAAVKKAAQLESKTSNKEALVIGLGEMGKLSIKHLLDSGFSVTLSNRSSEKILEFKAKLGEKSNNLKILPFNELESKINDFSFIFSATAAPTTIINKQMIKPIESKRFFFDLAIPRDIDTQISEIQNIQIFCVDDLKKETNENLTQKKIETHKAYAIIGYSTQEFFSWLESLEVEPLIREIRLNAKNAALQELEKAIKKGYLPKDQENEVKIILHNAFNVFLHNPTLNLRNIAQKQESDSIIESIKTIFQSKQNANLLNQYKCEYDFKKDTK